MGCNPGVGALMVSHVTTVAFQGIEAVPVDVQVQIAPGLPRFIIVGLPDKAVAESGERVRSALHASGLSLPQKRIIVNLAPADLPKEGSHYDLPIALALMAAIGALPGDQIGDYVALGELALDGTISAVAGVLPAAIAANGLSRGIICPAASGRRRRGRAATWRFSRHAADRHRQSFPPAPRCSRVPRPASPKPTVRCPTLPTFAGRRARGARWKSPPPAGTTC